MMEQKAIDARVTESTTSLQGEPAHFATCVSLQNSAKINNRGFRPTASRRPTRPIAAQHFLPNVSAVTRGSKRQTVRNAAAFKQWINVNCC